MPTTNAAADLRQDAAIRLAEVAEDAWNAGLEEEAREYLGLALTLSPDNEDWIARREILESTLRIARIFHEGQ